MAIRNFSLTLLALSFLAGCRTTPPKPTAVGGHVPLPVNAPSQTAPEAQPPPRQEVKKVAMILGPGGAKALAETGVLRALQQQRVPIDKVIGLEWGALVAGLFAVKGQAHDVEWKLYKMEQKNLPRAKGFFAKSLGEDSIKIMDDFLLDSFQKETLAEAKLPFECPSRSVWTGVVAWQNRGPFKDVIKRCMSFPPLFKAQGTFIAGASQASEAIDLLRSQGFNVIILVNVLGSALPVAQDSLLDNLNYVILWQEIKRSLLQAGKLGVETINVDTSSYPMVQFDAAKDLSALGEAAGKTAAEALISKYGFLRGD